MANEFTHKTVGWVEETERWVVCRKHRSLKAAEALVRKLSSPPQRRGFHRPKPVFVAACFPYVPTKFRAVEINEEL